MILCGYLLQLWKRDSNFAKETMLQILNLSVNSQKEVRESAYECLHFAINSSHMARIA